MTKYANPKVFQLVSMDHRIRDWCVLIHSLAPIRLGCLRWLYESNATSGSMAFACPFVLDKQRRNNQALMVRNLESSVLADQLRTANRGRSCRLGRTGSIVASRVEQAQW